MFTPPKGSRLRHLTASRKALRIAAGLTCSLLAACAQPPTIYSWDSYQPAVYDYLQGSENSTAHIEAMEKNVETARARGAALPPGFHAQLGLLYLQQGKGAQATAQIQAEKAEFPESTTFMDFLLSKDKAKTTGASSEAQTPSSEHSAGAARKSSPTPTPSK
jgi:hypothetical protein